MDIFNEAEMELGCEPGELEGTFPLDFVDKVTCQHENVIPHRTWDSGRWYWTCSDCYSAVSNQFITDRMREREKRRKDRRAEDALSRDIVDRNL